MISLTINKCLLGLEVNYNEGLVLPPYARREVLRAEERREEMEEEEETEEGKGIKDDEEDKENDVTASFSLEAGAAVADDDDIFNGDEAR